MFPNFNGTTLPVLVLGVLLAAVGSEESSRTGRHTATPGLCVLPDPLLHGQYRPSGNRCPPGNISPACLMTPGAFVPNDWVIFFKCDEGYAPNTTQPITFCKNGRWQPELPSCKRESCPTINAYGVDMKCTYVGKTVSCADTMRPGTVATLTCKEGYELPFQQRSTQLTCLDVGAWDNPPFYCIPGKVGVLTTLPTPSLVTTTPSPTPTSTPLLETTTELLPEGKKSVQKCQQYGATVRAETCAMSNVPITGRVDAQPHEYPHMAMIGVRGKERVRWLCIGSLISERFVLGCARCCSRQDKSEWTLGSFARLGAHDIYSTINESGARDYDIIDRILHPQSGGTNDYYDINLLKLKDNVKFNDFIRPICLQTEETVDSTNAINTGWYNDGEMNRILKKDILSITDSYHCTNLPKNQLRNKHFNTSMICAKHTTDLPNDWEGYLYISGALQTRLQQLNCMYSLVGILTFGTDCRFSYPWVYMRVSYYVPWIESVVWP